MTDLNLGGAVPLDRQAATISEIRLYPMAAVLLRPGGNGIGDATHHLAIVLPTLSRELRIPVNQQWLAKFARELQRAANQNGGQHEH